MSHLCPLQDPVITLELKKNKRIALLYAFYFLSFLQTKQKEKEPTLATSSRSLLGGASTSKGVIVAKATALAALKNNKGKKKFDKFEN